MSIQGGRERFFKALDQALKENTREQLDKQNIHIADLNKNTIIYAYRLDFSSANSASSDFTKSYNKFIQVVEKIVPSVDNYKSQNPNLTDIELAMSVVSDKKIKTANVWIKNEKLLVSSGFSAMSTIRTKIYSDSSLVNDPYFGKANRIRSIYDQLEDKGIVIEQGTIPDQDTLKKLLSVSQSAKGSYYIFPDMGGPKNAFGSSTASNKFKVYQLISQKSGKTSTAMLVPITGGISFNSVAIVDSSGKKKFYPAKKYVGFKAQVDSFGSVETEFDETNGEEAILLNKNLLSVADVGHAYFIDRATGRTPAGAKLNLPKELVDVFAQNSTQIGRITREIEKLKRRLSKAHGAANFTFYKNTLQQKINSSESLNIALQDAIVVTFQNYRVNARLAAIENKLIAKFKELVAKEILKIPGSNTLEQDLTEISINKIVSAITGKPAKALKPTGKISGKKDINIKSTVAQDNKRLSKISRTSSPISAPKPRVSFKAVTTNLTRLQLLLDAQLVQTVKQNMGGGSRRDILNLRTGRFAESVKVERLSESREGMITAFYSYMRNPYATFSSGGRQETPKTRDPKLLISKSIREVAAQLVTNRLRSVNV